MLEAAELARRFEAELELAHVFMPLPMVGTDLLAAPVAVEEELPSALESTLAVWRDEAERVAGRPVRSILLSGEPATELLRHAREREIDVLVVGTHGRKGLRRLVLGSVAERIVREAPCAVVVGRRREERVTEEVAAEAAYPAPRGVEDEAPFTAFPP
jgi:nucleotide-binding universal stress UspA family protein